ncbi:MAG: hypothetical protein ACT4QD_09350 [Acidobacteriota bacterium]
MITPSITFVVALVLQGAVAGLPPNEQPTATPARWAPWIGCWQVVDESIGEEPATLNRPAGTAAARGLRVCVQPADGAAATLTTFLNDQPVRTETIVPGGQQVAITDAGCRGWQRAEWSPLGARLYASAEIGCDSQSPRRVSGMGMMLAGPTWIDIQSIESDGRRSLRVRRYRPVARAGSEAPMAPQMTMPLGTRMSLADVKDAGARVTPEVLEAALTELRSGFDLDARALLDLDRAGVPDRVIDLMVALSFPERFEVVQRSGSASGGGWWGGGLFSPWSDYMDPLYYPSYYTPFGYRYWGGFNSYYFLGPGFVALNPREGESVAPSGTGRVVDGYGYTRVRRTQPEPANPRGNGTGWTTASTASSGSDRSGSSGGVSSSGYSSGGSSGGRTAQPRPPGGP